MRSFIIYTHHLLLEIKEDELGRVQCIYGGLEMLTEFQKT
jgi:hypothetical protein